MATNNLPQLTVKVTGLTVQDNFEEFSLKAREFLDSVTTEIGTPNYLALAKRNVKQMKAFEDALATIKQDILSEAIGINTIIQGIDKFILESKNIRTPTERKLVKATENIKKKELDLQVKEVNDYLDAANNTIAPCQLSAPITSDRYAGIGKGTKTLATYTAALQKHTKELLTDLKEQFITIARNLETYENEFKKEYGFLFGDLNKVVWMDSIAFDTMANGRISSYKLKLAEKELEAAKKFADKEVEQSSEDENATGLESDEKFPTLGNEEVVPVIYPATPPTRPRPPVPMSKPDPFESESSEPDPFQIKNDVEIYPPDKLVNTDSLNAIQTDLDSETKHRAQGYYQSQFEDSPLRMVPRFTASEQELINCIINLRAAQTIICRQLSASRLSQIDTFVEIQIAPGLIISCDSLMKKEWSFNVTEGK